MTLVVADRVQCIWTGTGAGSPISLGVALQGFQGFPASLNGVRVGYSIAHETAPEAEAGVGVYNSGANTLSRTYRTYPSRGGAAVAFSSGNKFVRLTKVSVEELNTAGTDPTSGEDSSVGYCAGRSFWLNTSTNAVFICAKDSAPAVWTQLGGGTGAVSSVNGATGVVVLDAGDIQGGYTPANYPISGTTILAHLAGIDGALSGSPTADAPPSQINSNALEFVLPLSARMHTNSEVLSHAANVDFEVPATAVAGSKWLIYPLHTGCTVSVDTNVGSVNGSVGGAARIIMNGIAIVEVRSNAGSAPVVLVRGNVIVAPVDIGTTKSYANDDSDQEYRLTTTSTQTFSASAGYTAGFEVILYREVAGSITIAGSDANYSLSGPDIVNVAKIGTALIATGKAGCVILDAA